MPVKAESLAANRKAFHDYTVIERMEAGVELRGTEVKSVRAGGVNLTGGFACVDRGELVLRDVHIAPYEQGSRFNHDPTRPRRLLMRAREIKALSNRIDAAGLTLVPLKLYFKRRWVKVELGLCRGKKTEDKRETLRRKTVDRETARAIGSARRK